MAGDFLTGNEPVAPSGGGGGGSPSSVSWDDVTNKPSFDYVESVAVEQDVSESQDKIPSSAAVSSDLAEAAAVAAAANVATEVKVKANKAANAATEVKVTANTDGVATNKAANATTEVKVTANTEGVAANKAANAATEARIDNLPTGGGSALSSVDWAHVTNKPPFEYVPLSDIEQDISESQVKIPSSAAVSSGLADAAATATAANVATEVKVTANTARVAANKAANVATEARIDNLPTDIGWDQVTNKPDFDYVATSRVEQVVTESQVNIPSSNAVAGVVVDLTLALHAANAETEVKVTANTEGVAANKAANAATEVRIDNLPTAPTDIGWDQVTNKPSFDYVATSRVEQEVTESQVKIPSSAAVAGDFIELTEALHAANATNDTKVVANTEGVAANKAGIAANKARIDNIPTGTNLTNFDRNLTEFDTSSVIPVYNPNNTTLVDVNNPLLINVSGFDGIPIGTSNLPSGANLSTDGTYFNDHFVGRSLNDTDVYSFVIHNATGISLTEHDEGFIRVRPNNARDLDAWSVTVDAGRIGTTRTIPAARKTVAAHDELVYHHNGGTEFTFPETEEGAHGDNTETIYALPQDWLDRGTPSLTFSITLYGNGTRIDTETRDSITINDVGQDQEGFQFNMTFLGFPTFVGFFYWKYRASDKSVILEYRPDNNRSVTVSFSANLHYPIPEERGFTPQHLSFVPFTHQPVANDTLIVTLHHVIGTDWQLMATDGDGAVLERGVYDMGLFAAFDFIYFRDTIQYQHLRLGGAGSAFPIADLTALHNQARVKGYGLFNFTDKTVFGLTAGHFINADVIDGLPGGAGGLAATRAFKFSDLRLNQNAPGGSTTEFRSISITDTGKKEGVPVDVSDYTFISFTYPTGIAVKRTIGLATIRIPRYVDKNSAISTATPIGNPPDGGFFFEYDFTKKFALYLDPKRLVGGGVEYKTPNRTDTLQITGMLIHN